ncbi:MAG: hypothetical protein COA88_04220 [Kordia sp.]|nr:MAG: hypothetical protein COA88_04220 [Kordia sp.]
MIPFYLLYKQYPVFTPLPLNNTNSYSGGHSQNSIYESSNTRHAGHSETVEVIYNPEEVSFATLVDVYFESQNPTQTNCQGPNRGLQFKSRKRDYS